MKKIKNNFKLKSFTIIECLFAVVVLSIISTTFFYSLMLYNRQTKLYLSKKNDNECIYNSFVRIKSNIYNGNDFLKNVDNEKLNISINEAEEIYIIKINIKGSENIYEMLVKK